jgi:phenylalanyl-tRNA synthetase beta chain
MKVSLSWIKEYLRLERSVEEISDALTLAGLEVDGVVETPEDVIFDVALTPNLGHCMSIVGIARELAAIFQLPLKRKKIAFTPTEEKNQEQVQVAIEAPNACYRYSCRLVKKVKVGPSPQWLEKKLTSCGLRSVNNVVDISNLVLLELGQPLHFFDYDRIEGNTLYIKEATAAAAMTTLDEQERAIPDGALLILDREKPLAFAGVMGELSSSVSEKTQNVLIEAAHFSPEAVRKTSKLLQLRTESSLRFERGIDPAGVAAALDFASQLLAEVAGGKICKEVSLAVAKEYVSHPLILNGKRANALLGLNLSLSEISSLLARLEIQTLSASDEELKVDIPSYRNDLKGEIDLIEEIGRMYGFNHIPRHLPRHASSTRSHSPQFLFEKETAFHLLGLGLQECITCDLISPELAKLTSEKALDEKHLIHVMHPASIDQSVLRPSLLPGLLQVVKHNIDRQTKSCALFEVGNIHFKEEEKFYSEPAASLLLTGKQSPYHFEDKPAEVDFFDLKGAVENFLAALGIDGALFEPSHLQNFHPGRQARVLVAGTHVGTLGEVLPEHLRKLGIEQRVYYAELDLPDLMHLIRRDEKIQPLPLFPGSQRDWTITLAKKVPIGDLMKELHRLSSPLLEGVHLLDLYKSSKIGEDRKNATLRFQYRDKNKTIEFEEVEKEHKKLTEHLENFILGKR